MVTISVTPRNSSIKKFLQSYTIGAFPLRTANGVSEMKRFKDSFGQDGDLIIPAGGELILNPENPIDFHNILTFKEFLSQYPERKSDFSLTDLTEAKNEVLAKRKLKIEALKCVAELEREEDFDTMLAIARRLNYRVLEPDRAEVLDFLSEQADASPDLFLKTIKDPDASFKMLIAKAIEAKILSKNRTGVVKYGDVETGQPIGKNEDEALVYLKHNEHFVAQIAQELEGGVVEKEKPAAAVASPTKTDSPDDLLSFVKTCLEKGALVKNDKGFIMLRSNKMGTTESDVVKLLNKASHYVVMLKNELAEKEQTA